MNEKNKKIIIGIIFLALMLCILAQSIIDNRAFRRADTEIDNLKRELVDARVRAEQCSREVEDSRRTVEQCYNSVGRIASTVREQSTELSGIIENLRTIRAEVESMENSLSFLRIKYGYFDDSDSDNGGE